MKKLLIVTLAFTVLFITSCNDENDIHNPEATGMEQEFLNSLPNDPDFQAYIENIQNVLDMLPKSEIKANEFEDAILNATTDADAQSIIRDYIDNPDLAMNYFRALNNSAEVFNQKNPDFKLLSQASQEHLINESAKEVITQFRNKTNFGGRTEDICSDQRASSLQGCRETGVYGAAVCGLFAPTVIGGIACLATAGTYYALCVRGVDRSFEICKDNSQ